MKRRVLVAVAAALIANYAGADSTSGDVERLRLAQLKTALEAALPIVSLGTKSQVRGDGGYVARWDKIEQELKIIIGGVDEALNLPRREPRVRMMDTTPTPISGEYLP